MRWLTIAVAVLGLALVGAGCGGDDEEAADETTVVVTDTLGTDDTTEDTTDDGTTTDDSDDPLLFASEDCRELAAAASALGSAFASPGSQVEGSEAFEELADRIPDEIEDDFQVLAEAYSSYADVIADIDIQPGEVPSAEDLQALQQALATIDQQEVTQASANITAWVTENCDRD
jgi:hypothetical protein